MPRLSNEDRLVAISMIEGGLSVRSCPENEMFCFNNQQTSPEKPGNWLCEGQAMSWKAEGLAVSLQLLHGDIEQIRREYMVLFTRGVAITKKLGFSDTIMPGEMRNDLYITMERGEFEKGGKSVARNVEITVYVLDIDGQILKGEFVACLLVLLRQMTDKHYQQLLEGFTNKEELRDFLLQIFTVFRILIRPEMFPKDWTVMRLVTNKVVRQPEDHGDVLEPDPEVDLPGTPDLTDSSTEDQDSVLFITLDLPYDHSIQSPPMYPREALVETEEVPDSILTPLIFQDP
ncbi:UNVERIFIED_CONTAM: hypothetical protein FKN15_063082 [Acipenser sinensis]